MKKNRILNFFLIISAMILVVVPLISGCQPKDNEPVKEKVTYNLGVLFIATTQNPFAAKMGKSDVPALQLVYEPLVLVGLDGTIQPWLAKSWSFDKTTSIYQIKLQEAAKWSNGKDVTADDVKYSYETYWAINHAQGLPTQPMVESITVVDEHTVSFKLKQQLVAFTELLQGIFIVPKHIWSSIATADLAKQPNANPVGSGPYKWTEFAAGDNCVFEARTDYWKQEVPIDNIIFHFYGSADAQLLALQNGDMDAIADLEITSAVPQLLRDPNMGISFSELQYTTRVDLNLRMAPFNILAFRQALNVVFDRTAICNNSYAGYGIIPQQIPLAPIMKEAEPSIKWPYVNKTQAERVTMANDILDKIPGMSAKPTGTPPANWVRTYNGTECSWELLHSTTATTVLVATTVVSNAASIGIKLTPKVGTATVVLNSLYRHGLTNDADIIKKWQIAIWGTPKVPSVDKFCAEFSGTPVDYNMDATVIGWNNPTVQKMLNDVRYEWDDVKRAELFRQAQILMAADLPEICLNHTITPGAYRTDKLGGWDTKIGGIVVFDTTTNSKYSINQVLKMYAVSKAG